VSAVVVLLLAGVAFALVSRSGGGRPQAAGEPRADQARAAAGISTAAPTTAGPTVGGTTSVGPVTSGGSSAWAPPPPVPPPGGGNPPAGLSRPAPPTNPVAEALDSTHIRLRWTDNADNEGGYAIIRYDGQRVNLPANSTSYTWTVSPHFDGCFAIGAYSTAGWSSDPFPPSQAQDWVCGQTPDLSPPTPPTNLTAAPDGPYFATVQWTNTAAEASEFGVLVMDAQQNAIKQTTVAGHSTNDYTVSIDVPPVLENPVTFCFKASAHNVVSGWSVWSNTACTTLPAVPAAASGLHATVDGTTVNLQWTDNSVIETYYDVIMQGGEAHPLPANSTSYDWAGLAPATQYCFHVAAGNSVGFGPSGPAVCVTTGPAA
jgi:hypothetical protein